MTGKDLFDAIHRCEDRFIEETAEELLKNEEKNQKTSIWGTFARRAAAVLLCIFVLGMGVSALAMASDTFREWIYEMFSGHEVTELDIGSAGTGDTDETAESLPDIPADENHRISLKDDMIVWGDRETVVAETHYDNKKEQIVFDRVYRLQGNGLKELTIHSYDGDYDGRPFSFEYVIVHQEIFGFNLEGAIQEVFGYVNFGDENIGITGDGGTDTGKMSETDAKDRQSGRSIYVQLSDDFGDQYKECIAKINLDTMEMEKLSGDQVYADCVISPEGTKILCLYRADNYATVFDLKEKTEKKIKAIGGASRASEIEFVDDDTILTYGDYVDEVRDGVTYSQQQVLRVDLSTGEVVDTYTGIGDISMEWDSVQGKTLTLRNMVSGDTFSVEGTDSQIHFMKKAGDYALFGNKEEKASYFLVNLSTRKSMKIDIPEELFHQVEIYMAGAEKKLLLANDTEGYIVDVSQLSGDASAGADNQGDVTKGTTGKSDTVAGTDNPPDMAVGTEGPPDIPADENQMLTLKKDMRIYGEKESFVCQVHEDENGEEVIEAVYAIEEDGLRKLPVNTFSGEYDGEPYSFSYAVIGDEVFGFHETGHCTVLPHKEGDSIYVSLSQVNKKSRVTKECLAEINLETEEVTKISHDKMICNFLMSPDGKIILCNHRSDGYWSVFDIAARTEKRVDSLPGYLHTDEIKFLDTYTVLTYGDDIMTQLKDGSWQIDSQTYKIDLRTGEILEKYPGAADLDMEWNYTTEGNVLKLHNIITGEDMTIRNVGENLYTVGGAGDYILFGYDADDEKPREDYCLVDLAEQTFMKMDVPPELSNQLEIYPAVSEKKLLLTNGTEGYIVDVEDMS